MVDKEMQEIFSKIEKELEQHIADQIKESNQKLFSEKLL